MRKTYLKGYAYQVQDIAIQAMINADCFGTSRLSSVKSSLIDAGFHDIANSEKLLDKLVFELGEDD